MIIKFRELLLGAIALACVIAAIGGVLWWYLGPFSWKGLLISAGGIVGMCILGSLGRKSPPAPEPLSMRKEETDSAT